MNQEFHKLDARSRMELEDSSPEAIISALVMFDFNVSAEQLEQLAEAGGKVISRIGTICTLDFKLEDLPAIHDLEFIKVIEFSRPMYPETTSHE